MKDQELSFYLEKIFENLSLILSFIQYILFPEIWRDLARILKKKIFVLPSGANGGNMHIYYFRLKFYWRQSPRPQCAREFAQFSCHLTSQRKYFFCLKYISYLLIQSVWSNGPGGPRSYLDGPDQVQSEVRPLSFFFN